MKIRTCKGCGNEFVVFIENNKFHCNDGCKKLALNRKAQIKK